MMRCSSLLFLFLALAMGLSAGCSSQMVKGNIYRKGAGDGSHDALLARLKTGRYAIFPFKGVLEGRAIGIATDGNAIADLLSIQMLYAGYNVLEREKMSQMLQEKDFKESDLAAPESVPATKPDTAVQDTNLETHALPAELPPAQRLFPKPSEKEDLGISEYVKIGKMLGVDFIVIGSVIQYEYQFGKGGLFGGGDLSLAVTITARVIDIQTGDIVFAMSAGTDGDNLPEALDGITITFTDALKENKVYVWE